MSVSVSHKEYLTTKEAAELCGFTTAALHQRRIRGGGPRFLQVGPKTIRYKRVDVLAYLEGAAPTEGRVSK